MRVELRRYEGTLARGELVGTVEMPFPPREGEMICLHPRPERDTCAFRVVAVVHHLEKVRPYDYGFANASAVVFVEAQPRMVSEAPAGVSEAPIRPLCLCQEEDEAEAQAVEKPGAEACGAWGRVLARLRLRAGSGAGR